ncbi:MAG TPA: bifunctional phosphopantothenoylcysteine decarboxylase/phosphopantothenate--cysteine ligase CoaBC [Pyrinomonadaceae bacterium]|nr:bifunctional phosphopantothenoylcysteine decarboxylase/phosphopantothenate--cysteine ligase CoaBC [Pyrinomonadaceae bacterium]
MSRETRDSSVEGRRVALGVSGGIAAYKAAEVLRGLQRAGCRVRVAMTEHATKMIAPLTFRALSGEHVVVDDYAADNPDPIAHITFSQTVDLLVVAPATANVIAKFANGVADDFLTTTYLACTAPVLVAPAMNTTMWEHPATRRNLERLRADGVHVVEPDAGEMACGTIGPGRLSAPEIIVAAALEILKAAGGRLTPNGLGELTSSVGNDGAALRARDLAGERVLITAGATREEIDPVRFITNRSSGRMGFALAEAARERGADVTIVAGATSVRPPAGVRVVSALSAGEMQDAVTREITAATVFIGAAAVADYRPSAPAAQKIKKSAARLTLELERTPDILAAVSESRHEGLLVVGFAAESERVVENAREKLRRKKLDAIVANDITADGAGFDGETNVVTLLAADREAPVELPLMSKLEAAHKILDEVARLRRKQPALAVQA